MMIPKSTEITFTLQDIVVWVESQNYKKVLTLVNALLDERAHAHALLERDTGILVESISLLEKKQPDMALTLLKTLYERVAT